MFYVILFSLMQTACSGGGATAFFVFRGLCVPDLQNPGEKFGATPGGPWSDEKAAAGVLADLALGRGRTPEERAAIREGFPRSRMEKFNGWVPSGAQVFERVRGWGGWRLAWNVRRALRARGLFSGPARRGSSPLVPQRSRQGRGGG